MESTKATDSPSSTLVREGLEKRRRREAAGEDAEQFAYSEQFALELKKLRV